MKYGHYLVIVTVLICETSAKNFCEGENEEKHFCKYKGEDYSRLCPRVTKTCSNTGEIMCICKEGYFRHEFWKPCVAWRECVVPNPSNTQILPTEEMTDYYPEDETTTEVTVQENDDASRNTSATDGEMLPCIWCPVLRSLYASIEPEQKPMDGSVISRRLVQTGHEMAPPSMRQWVKERSNVIIGDSTFTPWQQKQLTISLVSAADGRHVIQLNAPERTKCYFWTPQSRIGGSDFECDFIFNNYCHLPFTVLTDVSECL
nr:uncharacterized protein LOC129380686 isoform X2 [Dermacentor andersoni]